MESTTTALAEESLGAGKDGEMRNAEGRNADRISCRHTPSSEDVVRIVAALISFDSECLIC